MSNDHAIGIRVRKGSRVLHRDSNFHIALDSLPGATADLVGNRFEFLLFTPLMFCLVPTRVILLHYDIYRHIFRVSCLLSICLPVDIGQVVRFYLLYQC